MTTAREARASPAARIKRREQEARYRAKIYAAAHVEYLSLLQALGGRCAQCGLDEITLLTVDHIDGINWDRRKVRLDHRIKKYLEEQREGIRLRVLCRVCNSKDGRARQLKGDFFNHGETTSHEVIEAQREPGEDWEESDVGTAQEGAGESKQEPCNLSELGRLPF